MILKGKVFNGVTVYRKGIGYFLKLLQILKDYQALKAVNLYLINRSKTLPILSREALIYPLRVFTDIKRPAAFMRRDMKKTVEILMEIMRFNSIPSVQSKAEKETGIDDVAAWVIDTLAGAGYSWSVDYILDRIDLPTVYQLKRMATERRAHEYSMALLIQHSPKAATENINKMIGNEVYKSWADFKGRNKWQKK